MAILHQVLETGIISWSYNYYDVPWASPPLLRILGIDKVQERYKAREASLVSTFEWLEGSKKTALNIEIRLRIHSNMIVLWKGCYFLGRKRFESLLIILVTVLYWYTVISNNARSGTSTGAYTTSYTSTTLIPIGLNAGISIIITIL